MVQLRVLWIEDKQDNIKRYVQLLSEKGVDVITACNGEEAIEKIEKAQQEKQLYDVILLDIMMPRGEGQKIDPSVSQETMGEEVLRQMGLFNLDIPVVVVTAVADHELTNRISREHSNVTDVLKKPIKMKELREAINHVLPGQGA